MFKRGVFFCCYHDMVIHIFLQWTFVPTGRYQMMFCYTSHPFRSCIFCYYYHYPEANRLHFHMIFFMYSIVESRIDSR